MPDPLPPGDRPPLSSTLKTEQGDDPPTQTAQAPPYRAPSPRPAAHPNRADLPTVGQRIDDFELLDLLGQGAFARVFLARQLSLDRQVALKVSRNWGREAQTLASLEHDHIVRVFSEVVDSARDLRLLCMQYVPGTTLERVIAALRELPPAQRNGAAMLAAIDRLGQRSAILDPAALRDRELLALSDPVEAVCWLGARLAEALEHAHQQGVLHRDVKPANVLLTPYGRPLLADFNVAGLMQRPASESKLGGTLPYMAPEHLDAFNPDLNVPPEAVDARSDIYSLGVVLFELFTGDLPFFLPPGAVDSSNPRERVQALATQRREAVPMLGLAEIPPAVDRVVRRCLEPEPQRRYQTAGELARVLDGCRELRQAERALPRPGVLTRWVLNWPILGALVLLLTPHLLGSVVNITYNSLYIVDVKDGLTAAQGDLFWQLVWGYNAFVYPLCLALVYWRAAPVLDLWLRLPGPRPFTAREVTAARRTALTFSLWGMALSCLGWLPGGLLFPLFIHLFRGPVAAPIFGHFLVSFTISGLIALTYSVLAIEFAVLRILYVRLWVDPVTPRTVARTELAGAETRLRGLVLLAVLIPLAGAVMLLWVPPEELNPEAYRTFRWLVTGLMALGMAGLGAMLLAHRVLQRTLAALVSGE